MRRYLISIAGRPCWTHCSTRLARNHDGTVVIVYTLPRSLP